ncbi:Pectin lyase-like superfamily protein [Dorcoceras hygrometricum]|uniref:Pectin lyase-like superfamily protein n=1 Tax=Dorcoceras hygrometricum TaxID=472368 RepID=A0A2Z7AWC4_9LAMI|nr:Pectin lyase-like superfamily protein [Dorcoceras hygrometricum]
MYVHTIYIYIYIYIYKQIAGTIIASDDRSNYKKDGRHWLVFDKVINLSVGGGGIIDGNGNTWWENSCKINKKKPCKGAPTALTFYKCKNLVVKDLRIQNAQQMHVSFQSCTYVEASNLVVHSPEKSPNTDGIHITGTQNIQLTNTTIATGTCILNLLIAHKHACTRVLLETDYLYIYIYINLIMWA